MIDFDLTAVIPARLSSSRIEKKVFQKISSQQTLLTRKIIQLRRLLPADRVVVNTESDIIASHALKAGATVCFRDEFYADGHRATFSQLITHVVSNLDCEHVAWTPFVVPFFDEEQFSASFTRYKENVIEGGNDSLVSVTDLKTYIWDSQKPLNYSASKNHTISQYLPDWYQVTNGNYMAPKSDILRWEYLLGEAVYLDVRDRKCSIDIDTMYDLKLARAYEVVDKNLS